MPVPVNPTYVSGFYDYTNEGLIVYLTIPSETNIEYYDFTATNATYSYVGNAQSYSWDDQVVAGQRQINLGSALSLDTSTGLVTIVIRAYGDGQLSSIGSDNTFTFTYGAGQQPSSGGGGGGGGGGGVPCFLGDAPVLTPDGYVPISELQVGDKVLTPNGKAVAILSKSVTSNIVPCERHNPYVVPAGVFGATQDVHISPRHRIVLPIGLVQARKLGLRQLAMAKPFTYYNLKLEDEEHMVVAGMAVESLPSLHRLVFGSRR